MSNSLCPHHVESISRNVADLFCRNHPGYACGSEGQTSDLAKESFGHACALLLPLAGAYQCVSETEPSWKWSCYVGKLEKLDLKKIHPEYHEKSLYKSH
jgi:hypothetical protein